MATALRRGAEAIADVVFHFDRASTYKAEDFRLSGSPALRSFPWSAATG
jgi:hypothetical protein